MKSKNSYINFQASFINGRLYSSPKLKFVSCLVFFSKRICRGNVTGHLIIFFFFSSWYNFLHTMRKLHSGRFSLLNLTLIFVLNKRLNKCSAIIKKSLTKNLVTVSLTFYAWAYYFILLFLPIYRTEAGNIIVFGAPWLWWNKGLIVGCVLVRLFLLIVFTWIKVFFFPHFFWWTKWKWEWLIIFIFLLEIFLYQKIILYRHLL